MHRRQRWPPILKKQMQPAKVVITFAHFSHRPERRLEVIILFRHVVVIGVGRGLRFLKRDAGLGVGVGAAVIHVIAGQVAAGADFAEGDGEHVHRIDHDPAVIARHHSAAEFAGEIRILPRVGFITRFALAELVGGDGVVGALGAEDEGLPISTRHRVERAIPETLGISAKEWRDFSKWHRRFEIRPASARVERHIQAGVLRKLFEMQQIFSRPTEFVIELNANDGAAIFPKQPL